MLQPPALEKFFKFPLHIARQFLSLLCHKRSECRVILVNDLIEKGLLGSVALPISFDAIMDALRRLDDIGSKLSNGAEGGRRSEHQRVDA